MWNLLVVEDETIVRVGLKYMMDWEKCGIRWKSEASNGEDALRAMETEDIHIVMTDIRMPGMDGLELAKRIRERYPEVQIVFLSSYDEFAYAKEALKLGAVDYLHKPTMDEDEIEQTLRKAVERLESSQTGKRNDAEADRNEYYLSLLDKYTFPQRRQDDGLNNELFQSGFRIVVFRKRDDAVQADGDSAELRFMSILYLIQEYVAKDWGGVVFHRGFREVIWIAPARAKSGEADSANPAEHGKYLEQLRQKVLELLHVALIYSSSPVYERISELPDAYMEALLHLPQHEQSDNLIVRKTKEFVDKHLFEDITLAKAAAAVHVSPGYLSRIFLKEIGENFSDYVIRNKLEYARKQLRETNRKIYEIAAEIGYTNPHYFSKLFKERLGKTPLEYRNQ